MATSDQVREAMHAAPFRPFKVYLTDGRSYVVQHPDFIALSPNPREMTIHDEQGPHYIDMRAVVEISQPSVPEPAE